ncbi:MAG: hypothetical protein ABIU63_06345 [Chitinophagaceae bacterium]
MAEAKFALKDMLLVISALLTDCHTQYLYQCWLRLIGPWVIPALQGHLHNTNGGG